MIQIIDNTLMTSLEFIPYKEDLFRFCELLYIIGVDAIELPVRVYELLDNSSKDKFILNVACDEEVEKYPGFYRYMCRQELKTDQSILELQMNDIREIIRLKNYQQYKEVRIVGLDDLICHSYDKIIPEIISSLPNTVLNFCPENTYGCAGALALQWVSEHGRNITTSFAGCMNNAATEEVIMALRLAVRHKPNRDLTVLPELTSLYERFTNKQIGNKKPIIGKNIFKVEAGIHADGLYKNPVTYEAYPPNSVGGNSELVIGKHSGSRAVTIKMEQLNLPVPKEEDMEQVLDLIKCICTKQHKSLNDVEFMQLLVGVTADERNKAYY